MAVVADPAARVVDRHSFYVGSQGGSGRREVTDVSLFYEGGFLTPSVSASEYNSIA